MKVKLMGKSSKYGVKYVSLKGLKKGSREYKRRRQINQKRYLAKAKKSAKRKSRTKRIHHKKHRGRVSKEQKKRREYQRDYNIRRRKLEKKVGLIETPVIIGGKKKMMLGRAG